MALALVVELDDLLAHAHALGLAGVEAQLQVAREDLELGNLDGLLAVEAEFGEHRVHAAALGEREVALERRGRGDGGADVARLDQSLGAEGFAVAHQQVHRLLHGRSVAAVVHGFFFIAQMHDLCLRSSMSWGIEPRPGC
ncbi:hypothetical protein D3C85_944340 [compost metagenome]